MTEIPARFHEDDETEYDFDDDQLTGWGFVNQLRIRWPEIVSAAIVGGAESPSRVYSVEVIPGLSTGAAKRAFEGAQAIYSEYEEILREYSPFIALTTNSAMTGDEQFRDWLEEQTNAHADSMAAYVQWAGEAPSPEGVAALKVLRDAWDAFALLIDHDLRYKQPKSLQDFLQTGSHPSHVKRALFERYLMEGLGKDCQDTIWLEAIQRRWVLSQRSQ